MREFLSGHRGEIFKRGELVLGLKLRRVCRRSSPIPRTDILANITAEEVGTDFRPIPLGDLPSQLDRPIRNASARIERMRGPVGVASRHERVRWTGLNTARAGAAAKGGGLISFKFERGEQLA